MRGLIEIFELILEQIEGDSPLNFSGLLWELDLLEATATISREEKLLAYKHLKKYGHPDEFKDTSNPWDIPYTRPARIGWLKSQINEFKKNDYESRN